MVEESPGDWYCWKLIAFASLCAIGWTISCSFVVCRIFCFLYLACQPSHIQLIAIVWISDPKQMSTICGSRHSHYYSQVFTAHHNWILLVTLWSWVIHSLHSVSFLLAAVSRPPPLLFLWTFGVLLSDSHLSVLAQQTITHTHTLFTFIPMRTTPRLI